MDKLIFTHGPDGEPEFRFYCSPQTRWPAKNAGFRFRGEQDGGPYWYTADPTVAKACASFATQGAIDELRREQAARKAALEASHATASDFDVPVPDGLEYLPFQKAGILYILRGIVLPELKVDQYFRSERGTLVGDEMGLGKTIQAIGTINADESIKSALIIVPATIKINWKRELEKWLTRPLTVAIGDSKDLPTGADIIIINYDVLATHCLCEQKIRELKEKVTADPHDQEARKALSKISRHKYTVDPDCRIHGPRFDLLIVDEAHRIKSAKALRTRQVKAISAGRRLYLTGTPIVNRPSELWSILTDLDPRQWNQKTYWTFVNRYCSASKTRFGHDFSGASNLDELQKKLRTSIMVRRLKSEVLTELPPKVRQVIEIPANGAGSLVANEKKILSNHEARLRSLKAAVELAKASDDEEVYRAAVDALKAGCSVAFAEIALVRHATAVAKIPYVVAHVQEVLEEGSKVVIFAHHKDVVRALLEEFAGVGAVKLTGDSTQIARNEAIDAFQSDPKCRVFIGNIQAAGVGITLTASSHVIFAELDWMPGNITQAEDRCHRIGQQDSVLVQHLVLEGSIDATLAKTIVEKQRIIDQALDKATSFKSEPVLPISPAATDGLTRERVEKAAVKLTAEQVAAIHEGLQILAGLDPDRAGLLNNMGFNGVDSPIGHSLAETGRLSPKQAVLGLKLITKYHRQLPETLLTTARGEGNVEA